MKRDMKRDNAISPVIGSILLVAITVIIAAVIAAFVFGMTNDIQKTKIVAVTSDKFVDASSPDPVRILLTNHGGQDAHTLAPGTAAFTVTVNGDDVPTSTLTNVVGSSEVVLAPFALGDAQHIIVVAHFIDGTAQVVLDTTG